jgi:hypothetical protein
MQVDETHKLSSDDLVLVCWSFPDREDRQFYSKKGYQSWTKGGCVYTHEKYKDTFFREHTSDLHYFFLTMSMMKMTEGFLLANNITYIPFLTAKIDSVPHALRPSDMFYDYYNRVCQLPAIHSIAWNDNITNKHHLNKKISSTFCDTHPSPAEHALVLKSMFSYKWSSEFSTTVIKSDALFKQSAKDGTESIIRTYESMPINKCIIR